MPAFQTFGQQLASWREAFGLSQHELAHEVKTDWATVSKWENDVHKPGPEKQQRLEVCFEWPLGLLKEVLRHEAELPPAPARGTLRRPTVEASSVDVLVARSALEELVRSQRAALHMIGDLTQRLADIEEKLSRPPAPRQSNN